MSNVLLFMSIKYEVMSIIMFSYNIFIKSEKKHRMSGHEEIPFDELILCDVKNINVGFDVISKNSDFL